MSRFTVRKARGARDSSVLKSLPGEPSGQARSGREWSLLRGGHSTTITPNAGLIPLSVQIQRTTEQIPLNLPLTKGELAGPISKNGRVLFPPLFRENRGNEIEAGIDFLDRDLFLALWKGRGARDSSVLDFRSGREWSLLRGALSTTKLRIRSRFLAQQNHGFFGRPSKRDYFQNDNTTPRFADISLTFRHKIEETKTRLE